MRIASHLSRLGWRIEVLSVRPGYADTLDQTLLAPHPPFRVIRTHAFIPRLWYRRLRHLFSVPLDGRRPPGTPKVDLPAHAGGARRTLQRCWEAVFSLPDSYAGWLPFALTAAWLRGRKPDLVLATLPPFTAAVVGAALASIYRVPLVLDYRDPWSAITRGTRLPQWRRRLDQALEARCLRRAALVVTTTEGICSEVTALGARNAVVVSNAADLELLDGIEPTPYARFTIVYAGHFYDTRTAEPLLQALRILQYKARLPSSGLSLRILGASGPEVLARARALGVHPLVEIEPFLPYREAMSRMMGADVLLLVVGSTHVHQVPAKIFDYLAARRFVLALAPPGSEASSLVERLRLGTVSDPADIPSLVHELARRFGARSGENIPEPAESGFDARTTMKTLDAHLRQTLSRIRARR